jgi:hypothetical protein
VIIEVLSVSLSSRKTILKRGLSIEVLMDEIVEEMEIRKAKQETKND